MSGQESRRTPKYDKLNREQMKQLAKAMSEACRVPQREIIVPAGFGFKPYQVLLSNYIDLTYLASDLSPVLKNKNLKKWLKLESTQRYIYVCAKELLIDNNKSTNPIIRTQGASGGVFGEVCLMFNFFRYAFGPTATVLMDTDPAGFLEFLINKQIEARKTQKIKKPQNVYLIGASDDGNLKYVKIGISTNVAKRLLGLQTSCSLPLTILDSFSTCEASRIERWINFVATKYRTSGEWFTPEAAHFYNFAKFDVEFQSTIQSMN